MKSKAILPPALGIGCARKEEIYNRDLVIVIRDRRNVTRSSRLVCQERCMPIEVLLREE